MLGIIFDMDGTLLDTQRIYVDAWNDVGQRYGIDRLGDLHTPNCCGMSESSWKQYLRDHFPTLDIDAFTRDSIDYIKQNLKLCFKPGAEELMNFLESHRIPMAVASGSSRVLVEHHLGALGSLDRFDAIIGGDEIQNSKPAPDIFLCAAELIGRTPEECIVFEDSANGVRSALAAGMRCIGVPDIVPFSEEIKEHLFAHLASLDEAIPLIQGLI